jgi:hypothetical protein
LVRDVEGPTDWVWLIGWPVMTVALSAMLQWWWVRGAGRALTPLAKRVCVVLGTLGPMVVGGLAVVVDVARHWPTQ